MVEVWLIFNLFIPFSEVLLHTYMDYLRWGNYSYRVNLPMLLGFKCFKYKSDWLNNLNGREGKNKEAYKQGEDLNEPSMLFKHSKMKADLTSRNKKTQR